ncbi:unnamed protein product [Rotaria magnacalcarata]|uniref:Uncharacterized protein n=1 Tax=Rotaria magnacalcarata TaxID=392030 RepID=A0A816FJ65_9BILA|nr:unnamed protein product [Rotaria magnacalcarata]CAF1662216.1 unnamed protein product [Rotaria magnacalcarata]CAF1937633.1 unnamed protein product [Rotaria magnacalcarata]CAF2079563.1 unnamed protein product [Rotaria magnacalcarata]CAF2147559.1 unnamed protein product [Rotaria magnacalcarata]
MRRHRQIALLGFPGVGKSSLAHHFVYKQFYNDYDPSIKTNLQHQCRLNGQEYDLTIIDNAGSDQYTLNHSDFENSDAYILVYAIDDLHSFKMISKIRDKIMSTSAITRIPMVLVGNKIDRNEERIISSEDGRSLANSWKIPFVEASAMDFQAVQEIFEKSLKAMDNIDSTENGTNEYSNSNEKNNSRRSSNSSANINSNSKQTINKNLTNNQHQSNKTCLIS